MKPVMKTAVSGQRSAVRDDNGIDLNEGSVKGGMPAAERGPQTTLQFDESIGCYRWGVKGKA